MKKRFSMMAAAAALLLAATGMVATTAVAADDVLRIGTSADYQPFEYRDPSGKIVGFEIDVGNELCKRLNRKCEWIDQSFDGLIPGLRARKFDLIMATMSVTEPRKKVVDFSTPMFTALVKLMVKKGSDLEPTAESLKGKRVGVQQGSTMEAYAQKAWAPHDVDVVSYPDYTNAVLDLTRGRLDAVFQQAQTAQSFLDKPQGKNFELASKVVYSANINVPTAICIRKGDDALRAKVNKAIKAMLADGTIQKFAKKYFKPGNIEFPSAK